MRRHISYAISCTENERECGAGIFQASHSLTDQWEIRGANYKVDEMGSQLMLRVDVP